MVVIEVIKMSGSPEWHTFATRSEALEFLGSFTLHDLQGKMAIIIHTTTAHNDST